MESIRLFVASATQLLIWVTASPGCKTSRPHINPIYKQPCTTTRVHDWDWTDLGEKSTARTADLKDEAATSRYAGFGVRLESCHRPDA